MLPRSPAVRAAWTCVCIALFLAGGATSCDPMNDAPGDCSGLHALANALKPRLQWNFTSGDSVCLFSGIQCDAQGNVVEIDLHNLGLSGSLPPELTSVHKLQRLILYANELEGVVPSWLGLFPDLTDLNFELNLFGGQLPASLGNLSNLTLLSFGYNKITGSIPAEIGNLTQLRTFKCDYNQLQGSIPPEIGKLTQLRYLILSYNQLTGAVPQSFVGLENLFDLEIHNNYLTQLPRFSTQALPRLASLSAGFNFLGGYLPSNYPSSLVGLFLENNNFSGPISDGIAKLPRLRQLELDHNSLTGEIPPWLSLMGSLETLHLHDNQLAGKLPSNFGLHFENVTSLNLARNNLTGPLPQTLETLACDVLSGAAEQCDMSHNNFTIFNCASVYPCLARECDVCT